MKKLNTSIQESLISLLCFDTKAAKQVHGLIPYTLYNPGFKEIAQEAGEFFERHKQPCGDHLLDIIEGLKERSPNSGEIYEQLYYSIRNTKDEINRDYVLSQINVFARCQKANAAMKKCLPLLQRGTEAAINEVEGMLSGLAKANANIADSGTFLHDSKQSLRFLDSKDEQFFSTGIKALDKHNAGPKRKGLWVCVGATNSGKSHFAVHKGKIALMSGKRVCHITLEMSEEEVCQRYMQSLYSISLHKAKEVAVKRFKRDELGRMSGFSVRTLRDRPAIEDENIREYLKKKLEPLSRRPRLVVREFPTGQLTVRQLTAYLDHMEAAHSLSFDLILIDYPDLMSLNPKFKREELSKIYVDLRGMAMERNLAVCAYSQSNRLGLNARLVTLNKIAEDIGKANTADTVITYNATEAEQKLGLARLFVAKNRGGEKGFQVLISQAYSIGQFCLSSIRMVDSVYWPLVEGNGANDESED